MERAERNIRWIEKYCRIPDGPNIGKPFILVPWQREAIHGIYSSYTRRALIIIGRKNAKTATSAALTLVHLIGPEAKPNSQLYSTALSRDQAAIIYDFAAKIAQLSPDLRDYVVARHTVKQLYSPYLGTLYKALSSDAPSNLGSNPAFFVHDELGQVRGPRHALYEALETATGTQAAPLSVIISTQATNDSDLLSILIDDALEEKKRGSTRTKIFIWAADPKDDPFSIETIKQANPSFDFFQNQEEILEMANDAHRMPAREASYRNLILNQRVEASNPLIPQSVWEANSDSVQWSSKQVYGGLDLATVNDLCALVLISKVGGKWHVKPTFWLPGEGLAERSRRDRVPYDVWAKDGFLKTAPGKSVEYEYVAKYIAEEFEKSDIRKIAFDRYNMKHLRPWLIHAGLSESLINERFVDFGQGFVSMGPALRNLESLLLNGKFAHGNHPVLTMCAVNAVVRMNEAGDRKLDKKRSSGRIDGMVALTMAAAVASEDSQKKKVYPVPIGKIVETLHA